MPDIDLDNDEYTFKVQVKTRGVVLVDAFELSSKLLELGVSEDNDPDPKQISDAVRAVGWMEKDEAGGAPDVLGSATDHELFAVGTKVLAQLDKLGNASRPQPSSPRRTASLPAGAAA